MQKILPSISRFITEPLSSRVLTYVKISLCAFVSGILLLAIVFQSLTLYRNLDDLKKLESERWRLSGEIQYWKLLSGQYKGYRDVYYRIATLEYRMGNLEESKKYIRKALEVDPNFKEGRVLGAKIGI